MLIVDDIHNESVLPKAYVEAMRKRFTIESESMDLAKSFMFTIHRTLPVGINDGDMIDGVRHCLSKGPMISDLMAELIIDRNTSKIK